MFTINLKSGRYWYAGEMKNAETLFQSVYDRASKGTNAAWKKFLFGSSVGMVRNCTLFSCSVPIPIGPQYLPI